MVTQGQESLEELSASRFLNCTLHFPWGTTRNTYQKCNRVSRNTEKGESIIQLSTLRSRQSCSNQLHDYYTREIKECMRPSWYAIMIEIKMVIYMGPNQMINTRQIWNERFKNKYVGLPLPQILNCNAYKHIQIMNPHFISDNNQKKQTNNNHATIRIKNWAGTIR